MDLDVSTLYRPLKKQADFHRSRAKFKAYIGGFGSGKTKSGCYEAFDLCMESPGVTGVICRNTYPELADTTRQTFLEMLDEMPKGIVKEWNQTQNRLVLAGGSKILFRSLDRPEKFKSLEIGFFYIDEASEVREDIYLTLVGRLRNKKAKRYCGFITSNPPDIDHWIYKRFVENKKPEHAFFHAPTYDNPYLPKGYIESLKATYPYDWVRVYLEGEFGFIPDGEPVYKEFDTRVHVKKLQYIPSLPVLVGLDFGYHHPAAVFCQKVEDRLFVLGEFEGNEETVDRFAERMQAYCIQKFGRGALYEYYGDPAGRQVNDKSERTSIDILHSMGIHVRTRQEGIKNGLLVVRVMLHKQENNQPRLLIDPSCTKLIRAFQGGYRYPKKEEIADDCRLPKKDNVHDHICDAIRYLVVDQTEFRKWLHSSKQAPKVTGSFDFWRKLNGKKRHGAYKSIRI